MTLDLNSSFQLRNKDKQAAFAAVYSGSDLGLEVAFDFVEQNFEEMTIRYLLCLFNKRIV
jgi:hypothetical protein